MPEHTTIHVSFIDEKTGQDFAQVKMPIGQLPDELEGSTLHMGDTPYLVLSATPQTAREWSEGGTLRLVLREQEVTTVDPKSLLYSLPTLSDEMPGLAEGTTKQGRATLELHEDDWRQLEFVSLSLQESVEKEMQSIARIHTQHREGPGFNALHIRSGVPRPLEGTRLTRAELHGALGESTMWLEGLSLQGVEGLVEGGFAARLASGLFVYGIEREEGVSVLGVEWEPRSGAALDEDTRLLTALANRWQLGLIDWCRMDRARLEPARS